MTDREQSEAQTRQQWALREALGGAIREQLHHKATRRMIIQTVTWGVFIGLAGAFVVLVLVYALLSAAGLKLGVPVEFVLRPSAA